MPSQQPSQTLQSVLAEVRNYLRDHPELNRLIEGEETSDRQMRWYIAEVVDDWNLTPPPIGYQPISRIPRSLLIKGVVAEVLFSVAILNLRNSLRYTDGQVTVDLDKHQALVAMSQMLKREYEMKRDKIKVSQNIANALSSADGLHSEYYYFSAGYYGNTTFTSTRGVTST